MLNIDLDESTGIAVVRPEGALSANDFVHIVQVIDPYLEARGELNGLVIYSRDFPGWRSFGALVKHLKFVKNHQRKVSHIALVTDSWMGWVVDRVASHFTGARVRHFPYSELNQAKSWIAESKPAWVH
jgi:hypothetical protein